MGAFYSPVFLFFDTRLLFHTGILLRVLSTYTIHNLIVFKHFQDGKNLEHEREESSQMG